MKRPKTLLFRLEKQVVSGLEWPILSVNRLEIYLLRIMNK